MQTRFTLRCIQSGEKCFTQKAMSEIDTTFKVNCASITTKKVRATVQNVVRLLDASFEAFSSLLNGLVQEVI